MSTQRTVFVARALTQGGVGTYVHEVLREFNDGVDTSLLVVTDDPSFVAKFPNLEIHVLPKTPVLFWDNALLFLKLLQLRPKSVVYPKNVIPLTHIAAPWKKIIVVHDLAFMYPELKAYKWLDTLYMRVMLPFSLHFADAVSCDSQFTKDEILKFFPWVKNEILHVVPLGVREPEFFINKKLKHQLWPEYKVLLYVGSVSPRKNVLTLVKAFLLLRKKRKVKLVLVVARSWSQPTLYALLPRLHKDIHVLGFQTDAELNVLYQLADVFVFPSVYEGFGLPVLEALMRDVTSVILRGAALSLLHTTQSTYINPEEFELDLYTWKKTAQNLVTHYE